MVVLFQQYTENICFFSKISAVGLCDWGILLVISLKFQMNNRKNALNVESAKGKTGEKGCIFHRTVEMKQPQTITEPRKMQHAQNMDNNL